MKQFVTTLYRGDDKTYIWMPGDNSICLVNPDTLVHDKVMNFFGQNPSPKMEPITAIASNIEKKVMGIYFNGETATNPSGINFVFLRAGHGMVRKE
jgi:hypothetical protein